MPGMPPETMISASPSVAQLMPSAPAATWRSAMRTDLCVLACGLSATPAAFACAAIAAMLRSSASRSTTSAGVSSRARLPVSPIRRALGPRSGMVALSNAGRKCSAVSAVIVGVLAVGREVEPLIFLFGLDAQLHDAADQLDQQEGRQRGPQGHRGDAEALRAQLRHHIHPLG